MIASTLLRWVLAALVATSSLAPARDAAGSETDPVALQAERTLRCAELRESDEVAMELYRRASRQAEEALERNPDSPTANFVYFAATGRLLLADGLVRNLLALRTLDREHLDRALSLDPDYANALAAKGGVLLDLPVLIGGDPAEGLRLLRRASALNPGGVGTRVSLARALARSGETDEAHRQARLAAHYACLQGRRKALDAARELLDELEPAVARADRP